MSDLFVIDVAISVLVHRALKYPLTQVNSFGEKTSLSDSIAIGLDSCYRLDVR